MRNRRDWSRADLREYKENGGGVEFSSPADSPWSLVIILPAQRAACGFISVFLTYFEQIGTNQLYH